VNSSFFNIEVQMEPTNKGNNKMKQNEILNNFNFTINHLKDKNEILNDKVKHLECMLEIMDSLNKDAVCYYYGFESYNHKTFRNTDGKLITYYTK